MLLDTSKCKNVKIMYELELDPEERSFVVATGDWSEDGKICERNLTLCRWEGKNGDIGYPQSFGKSQWMLIPEIFGSNMLVISEMLKRNMLVLQS